MFLKSVGVLSGVMASSALIAACGGGGSSSAQPTQAGSSGGGAVTLDIGSKGEEPMYDKDKLQASAGSKITLNFKNNSTALSHNWVLVKPGTQDSVAAAGITAGEAKGYIPDDPNIIAHTPLTKPGQTDTITFDAPAAGDYPYICTFPGHSVLMKGTLTIK
jgi:azurin